MKVIESSYDALLYVNRLGFAGSGTIAAKQSALGAVADALIRKAGEYPYRVRFVKVDYHYSCDSYFLIKRKDGEIVKMFPRFDVR